MTTNSGVLGGDRRDDRFELDLGQQLDRRVDEAEALRAQARPARPIPRRSRRASGARRRAPPPPAAAASTCRCRDRRRAAPRRPRRGRRRARDRTPSRPGRDTRGSPAAPTADERRDRRSRAGDVCESASARGRCDASRRACSTRRNAGTGPAISAPGRRTRCSCRRSSAWPWSARPLRRRPASADRVGQLGGMRDGGAELADDDAGGLVGDAHGVGERSRRRPSNAPSAAITVSPAPETSYTSRACAGIVSAPSASKRLIPSSERVTSSASSRARCAAPAHVPLMSARRASGRRLRGTRRDWA